MRGKVKSVLDEYGVAMMTGHTGNWSPGDTTVKVGTEDVPCDLLLRCNGMKFNGGLMATHFGDALTSQNRIKCDGTLQVTHKDGKHIFCCGDIIAIPEGRASRAAPAMAAEAMAAVVTKNIIDLMNNSKATSEYTFPATFEETPAIISLGPDHGAGALPCVFCCWGCCGCLGGYLGRAMKGDGFIAAKQAEFGHGKTWNAADDAPPGSAS